MKEIATYAFEVLICSGVLFAAYMLLLQRRTPYLVCRLCLIGSMILAAVIPLLRIPIWAPAETAHIQAGPAVVATISNVENSFDFLPNLLIVYLLGVLLLFSTIFRHILRLNTLHKGAHTEYRDSIRILHVPLAIGAFSFMRTIYLPQNLTSEEREMVIAHEASHILHRHSTERLLMEGIKALMWWNPFAWLAARRLTEVQEFEADHDVIRQNTVDISFYMKTIFRQLFGYSPNIANGLRNSLTKKRFEMMTTNQPSRHVLLHITAIVPVIAALLITFSSQAQSPNKEIGEQENEIVAITGPICDTPPTLIKQTSQDSNEEIYSMVESMPTFQGGGIETFSRWLGSQMRFPPEAAENGISGKVLASFIIEKDGTITNIKIERSVDALLDNEVIRILKSAPKWEPGKSEGKPVRVSFMLPVWFQTQ